MRTTRNRVYGRPYRGFESPYLRQGIKIKPPNFLGGMFLPWAEIGGWVRMSGAYHAPHENSIFVKRDMHDQYADKQLQNMQKRIFFIEFLHYVLFLFIKGERQIKNPGN